MIAVSLFAAALAATPAAPADPLALDPDAFGSALQARFNPPPPPAPKVEQDPHAGQVADAAYFTVFPDLDRAYSTEARARAEVLARKLAADAGSLDHDAFVMRVAEIAALADNGHTGINDGALQKNTRRISLRTFPFADGLYVLKASTALSDLLGARIDRIEGRPVGEVFDALSRYAGGTSEHRRLKLLPVLESPGLLHAAGIAGDSTNLRLQGVKADGTPFDRTIAGEPRGPSAPVMSTARLLFPAADGESAGLNSFQPKGSRPVWLSDRGHVFTLHALDDEGFYIGIAFNNDADEGRISTFLAQALLTVSQTRPRFIVVDMRMNGGGDYTKTYPFASALADAAGDAPIYVLTSGFTFSAAITTTAAFKQFGAGRTVIVGEPVGDRLDFWAEGERMTLPNVGMLAFYTTGRHNYTGPCLDPKTCFWLNWLYPVRVKTLAPDIAAPLTFEAYARNDDPAMDEVYAREQSRRAKTAP